MAPAHRQVAVIGVQPRRTHRTNSCALAAVGCVHVDVSGRRCSVADFAQRLVGAEPMPSACQPGARARRHLCGHCHEEVSLLRRHLEVAACLAELIHQHRNPSRGSGLAPWAARDRIPSQTPRCQTWRPAGPAGDEAGCLIRVGRGTTCAVGL